ncbi:UDP-glycosyltransferase UGT5-like [Cydia fagiglandana]|uniref:UDP-glycosyltransferase UGT5-like n=1 Tax=Cydia fagiglandana TaxID=1458189 RepID=UPI002FEE0461
MSVFANRAAFLVLVCFFEEWKVVDSSRVLVVSPSPIHSHQVPFQALTKELLRRGHHVTILTTDPIYPPGQASQNITEIDLNDVSYKFWTDGFRKVHLKPGNPNDFKNQIKTAYDVMYDLFPKQMKTEAVRDLLADKTQKFDLVIIEAWVYQASALAHIYNAPAILMSTMGIEDELYEDAGVPIHPIIYPDVCYTRRYNLLLWEYVKNLYNRVKMHYMQKSLIEKQDMRIKEMFGADMPSVREMRGEAVAHLVSLDPMWEGYRPLSLKIVHIGGLHVPPPKELPKDIKSLMDSSKHGVIYMSFGSQMRPAVLPAERLEIFVRVFSTLPYDVILKSKGDGPAFPSNVHIFSWLPQPDLLRHEKLLLFITQGGLQSTEEALRAGIPLLGIPLMLDQWLNVENYERLGVGLGLDLHTLSETQLRETIDKLINDKRYRDNSIRVGREMQDQPQTSLQRAVWCAERAMRLHGRQMPTPPPPLTWDGILETLMLAILIFPLLIMLGAIFVYRMLRSLALKVLRVCKRLAMRERRSSSF